MNNRYIWGGGKHFHILQYMNASAEHSTTKWGWVDFNWHMTMFMYSDTIYWSQVLSREWRCSWSSAAGSEWSTNLLPTKVRLILEVWRHVEYTHYTNFTKLTFSLLNMHCGIWYRCIVGICEIGVCKYFQSEYVNRKNFDVINYCLTLP